MKAAIFREAGKPLSIESVDDPTPAPGHVVLKVGRCGICSTDLHWTDAHSPELLPAGSRLGHEFSGEVVALGKGVEHLRIGDRVAAMPMTGCGACVYCAMGEPMACRKVRLDYNGYAEYCAPAAAGCIKLPSGLSFADGALVEPMAVALHGFVLAQMQPGSRVLVMGAGPIGLAAAFWARRLGAGRVAVTATSRRREALAMQMGADAFIAETDNPVGDVNRALGGKPEIIVECVGNPGSINQAFAHAGMKAKVIVAGYCMVPDTFSPALGVTKQITMMFSSGYTVRDYQTTVDAFDAGAVEPRAMLAETVGLSELPLAFEALRGEKHKCKVHLDPFG